MIIYKIDPNNPPRPPKWMKIIVAVFVTMLSLMLFAILGFAIYYLISINE